jgi:uncharacterized protein YjdB
VALALYSDGGSLDVSERVIWRSSDPKVAVVQQDASTLIALAAGTTTVTAFYTGVQDSVTVTVVASQPRSMIISPTTLSVSVGDFRQVQAILVYDDGSSREINGDAQWRSSNTTVVEVDGGSLNPVQAGMATITASYAGFSATCQVTVSAARLKSLAIMPGTLAVPVGQSRPLSLIGQYEDGSTRDLTGRATWITSDAAVALVTSGASSAGLVVGVAAGTATITATFEGQRATATVTVQ